MFFCLSSRKQQQQQQLLEQFEDNCSLEILSFSFFFLSLHKATYQGAASEHLKERRARFE